MQNASSLDQPLVDERRTSRGWHRSMMKMSLVSIAVMAIGLAFLFLSARPSKDTLPSKSVEEANFLQRHGSSGPHWKTGEKLLARHQLKDVIKFSHRGGNGEASQDEAQLMNKQLLQPQVNRVAPSFGGMQKKIQLQGTEQKKKKAGSNFAVAETTPAVIQYVAHNRSACAGQLMDEFTYYFPNGSAADLITPGDDDRYSFDWMWYCAQDPACGGFTQEPNGHITFYIYSTGFNVNASEALVGYHCFEKTTDHAVKDIPDGLISAKFFSPYQYGIEKSSIDDYCTKFAPFFSKERRMCFVDRVHYAMSFDFGHHFLSPFAWYLMPDGDVKIDGSYGEAQLNASLAYIDRWENICDNSSALPPTTGVPWGSYNGWASCSA